MAPKPAPVPTRNLAPCDLGQAVMKINSSNTVRMREDDEATFNDDVEVPTFYIICPATAVSCCT